MDKTVEKFGCYGKGWLFNPYEGETHKDLVPDFRIDLSKVEFGKGWTIAIPHIGYVDPLFGGDESDYPWFEDMDFILFIIEKFNLKDKFLDYIYHNHAFSNKEEFLNAIGLKEEEKITDDYLQSVLKHLFDANYSNFVREALNYLIRGKIGNDSSAICGIIDEEYFKDALIYTGYNKNELVDVASLEW